MNMKIGTGYRPLLTEEQQKMLDLIKSMSHEELAEWSEKVQLPFSEGKSVDHTQYIDDMTLEEFVKAYDLIDITDRVMSCGRNMINDGTDI